MTHQAADEPSRNTVALRSLKVLRRAIDGDPAEDDNAKAALETLLEHFDYQGSGESDDDECDTALDEGEMDEALARARLGELIECLIHLGRGLPRKFGGISDALEKAVERGR